MVPAQNLGYEPGNRALADIVAACNAALRLARFEALASLLLLMRGEDRLAAEFDTVRLGVGPAARGAFKDAAALQLGGNTENGQDNLGKVGCGV